MYGSMKTHLEAELKAIRWPSGDQVGSDERKPRNVTCLGFEPSLSQIQMSPAPERVEPNAICRPSGE